MALRRRNKVAFDQKGIDRKYYFEAYDVLAVDDVLAFMAQSEAQRRVVMRRAGEKRDPQVPSDDLKKFLMDTTG